MEQDKNTFAFVEAGGEKKSFFFFHFLRLLSCFNPILTLSNNCYLLIIFTIEG